MTIREEIGKRILFFDGGMGTLLQEQGLQAGELPETWNLKNPEPIIQIHKAYLAAGADIILANTFGANRFKYGEDLEKIVTAGAPCHNDSLGSFRYPPQVQWSSCNYHSHNITCTFCYFFK